MSARWRVSLLVILLVGCGESLTFLDDDPPLPAAADVVTLHAQLLRIMEEEGVPGAVVGLVRDDGTRWVDALGFSNLETRAPMGLEMPFRAGSVTKTLLGLAMLRQWEAGRIDLDARVADVLPGVEFHNPFETSHPLRVVHLLEHTSGFDDSRPMEFLLQGERVPTLLEVLAVNPRPRVSRWAPGTRHAYANPTYTMAGALLERVTSQRFEDHLRDHVLLPLGMAHATLDPPSSLIRQLPQGYVGSRRLVPVAFHPILHRPAGNLVATLDDLLHLAAFLARGTGDGLLRADTLESMQEPRSLLGVPLKVGFGMGVQRWQVDGWQVVGHGGNVDGFSSVYGHVPGQHLGLAILTNANNAHGALDRMQSALLGQALAGHTPTPEPAVVLSSEERARITGFYQGACSRTLMLQFVDHLLGWRRIEDVDGKLWLQGFARTPLEITPVAPNQFRVGTESTAGWFLSPQGMLFNASRCFQREPEWPRTLERGFVFFVIPAVMSPLAWPLTRLRRRRHGTPRDVIFPLLGAVAMLGCLTLLGTLKGLYQFSPILNPRTVGFFSLPLLLAASATLGLPDALWRLRSHGFTAHRLYALLWAAAALAGALYMNRWGQLGFALWAY